MGDDVNPFRLYTAVLQNNYEEDNHLRENGAYVNAHYVGYHSIYVAGVTGIIELLTDIVDYVESFPLHVAVFENNFEEVNHLIENGADVNALYHEDITPLHIACCRGSLQIVQILYEKGAWLNAGSDDSGTPLFLACAGGHIKCVKFLLQKGAFVNPSFLSSTPLHEAARRGHVEIASLLIEYKAKLDTRDFHFDTPLHAVCYSVTPSFDIFNLLLKAGANANAIKFRKTPLHVLAMNSQDLKVAKLLLDYGANVYLRDGRGRLASEITEPDSLFTQLLHIYERTPKSLLQCCRLKIRSCIGSYHISFLSRLSLPSLLLHFLE